MAAAMAAMAATMAARSGRFNSVQPVVMEQVVDCGGVDEHAGDGGQGNGWWLRRAGRAALAGHDLGLVDEAAGGEVAILGLIAGSEEHNLATEVAVEERGVTGFSAVVDVGERISLKRLAAVKIQRDAAAVRRPTHAAREFTGEAESSPGMRAAAGEIQRLVTLDPVIVRDGGVEADVRIADGHHHAWRRRDDLGAGGSLDHHQLPVMAAWESAVR